MSCSDKPIVFIDSPLVYERHGIDNLHHRLRACGTILRSIEDLKGTVSQQLEIRTEDETDRMPFIKQLSYNRGSSTDESD